VDWVQVASFCPAFGDMDADLAVAKLHANGIPALRFPVFTFGAYASGAGIVPTKVMVPADRADEALGRLREDEDEIAISDP
jgi:hypothetical protein